MFAIVSIFYLSKNLMNGDAEPSLFDVPKKLEETKMGLKVWLQGTPGGAQVFSTTKSGGEGDRLYLINAAKDEPLPSDLLSKLRDSGYVLKLYGAFYKGKGIPEKYLYIQPKPARLPVFRFESLDIVKE